MKIGFGDDIIATGLARKINHGKRAAFGDGRKIIWGLWSEAIFKGNPRIARPGEERAADLQWINYYKGCRIYNTGIANKWIWNYKFKVTPGELFFSVEENQFRNNVGHDFILVEPNPPWHKPVSVNKDWGEPKFQMLVDQLVKDGRDVVQLLYDNYGQGSKRKLSRTRHITTSSFRHALAVLSRASFAVLPEGGMHHGAAALGIPAAVLFGGFAPPQVLGYDQHFNLTGDEPEACGNRSACRHCAAAMKRISVEEVHDCAVRSLARY
jgi:hypothetical protein